MRRAIIALAFILSYTTPSRADGGQHMESSGNDFLSICGDVHEPKRGDSQLRILTNVGCIQYVGGVAEGFAVYKDFLKAQTNPSPKELVCSPGNVTGMQFVNIVVKYVKDHPEFAHHATAMLIFGALSQAFPYPNTAPSLP